MNADVVRGESVHLKGNLNFYLPAGGQKYLPIDAKIARLLSESPEIITGAGLAVISATAHCLPLKITSNLGDSVYQMDGGQLIWSIVLAVDPAVLSEREKVSIKFPTIEAAQSLAANGETILTMNPPRVEVLLRIWTSREAKEIEERRLQDERLHEKQAKQAAQRRIIVAGAVTIGCVTFLLIVGFRLWSWIFPTHRVGVSLNSSGHIAGKVTITKSIPQSSIDDQPEPYTAESIVRHFWGTRADVEVHLSGIYANRKVNQITTTYYTDGAETGSGISHEAITDYDVIITVQPGKNARAGKCLATTPAGTVLIHIT